MLTKCKILFQVEIIPYIINSLIKNYFGNHFTKSLKKHNAKSHIQYRVMSKKNVVSPCKFNITREKQLKDS